MKKIIFLLFIALQGSNAMAQFNVYLKSDGQVVCNDEQGTNGAVHFYNGSPSDAPSTLIAEKTIKGSDVFNENCKDAVANEVELKPKTGAPVKVSYKLVCKDKTIVLSSGGKELETLKFENGEFKRASGVSEAGTDPLEQEEDTDPKYSFIRQIAYPILPQGDDAQSSDQLKNSKCNRYLILDANPNHNKKINNSLFKPKDTETFGESDVFNDNFERADALPVNASLTVFVKNYNFHDLQKITVDITGSEYSYNYSIKDILGQLKAKDVGTASDADATAEGLADNDAFTNDLEDVLARFKSYTYLNLNDLYKIEEYKKKLYLFYESHFESFNKVQIDTFSEIMHWYPPYLSITPISLTVPDKDEVEIKVTITNKGETTPSQTKVGNFKTTGGIGFNLGGMFYITNLKNNSIYTKPSETADRVRAFMNSDNQSSVGLGLNSEIYFRTGYLLRPTLNVGFFIPFDEDLTPFGALGPGISLASKRVKLSFSWGLAVGKVNSIKEEYKDQEIDPAGLTNDQLAEKVWKFGNYFGFGLTYNLTSE